MRNRTFGVVGFIVLFAVNLVTSLFPLLDEQLQACESNGPLGMISGAVEDSQITASSTYPSNWDAGCHERYARLYQPNGVAWCSKHKSSSEWLQVDLGVPAKVTGLMTQGRADGTEWVTAYMVSYSLDAYHWSYVTDYYGNRRIFDGNSDSYQVKHAYLDEPIIARYVKFHTTRWNRHPSLRVEIIGCQVCRSPIALPPYGKISASSERSPTNGSSCLAEDGFIITQKGWCAKDDNVNQWLQFDVGPATLITGVVTRGRGETGRRQWVTRYLISYSNDSSVWYFYKDASHLEVKRSDDPLSSKTAVLEETESVSSTLRKTSPSNPSRTRSQRPSNMSATATSLIPDRHSEQGVEFGGNSNRETERYHYFIAPFVARYVRFHPVEWFNHISMRAGIVGCPHQGDCGAGFLRVIKSAPCVENVAFKKDSWINNKRQHKRHVRNQWTRGHASRAVDGDPTVTTQSCTVLDNFYVDKPTWLVDLGHRTRVSGVKIITWQGHQDAGLNEQQQNTYAEYIANLDRLTVYIDSVKSGVGGGGGGRSSQQQSPAETSSSSLSQQQQQQESHQLVPSNICGFVSRFNDAIYRPVLHIQCSRPLYGRYLYIEATGVPSRRTRLFSAVLCEVMVYQ